MSRPDFFFFDMRMNAGRHEVVDLIPNGRNVMVTDENKLEYVQRITHHRMTHSIRAQIESFLEGKPREAPAALVMVVTGCW